MKPPPPPIRLQDYRPPDWLVSQVRLNLDIRQHHVQVTAELSVSRNPLSTNRRADLCLNGENLELLDIRADGEAVAHRLLPEQNELWVSPPAEQFCLTTTSRMQPQNNHDLMGLYRSSGLYCTQCEPEGFRRICWYPDRPDVLARFRTRIEANSEQCPVLLSNGNPIERGAASKGRHYVVWDDPHPKPCYLFALVAGDLQHLEGEHITASGKRVGLHLYASPGRMQRMHYALQALRSAMAWDEERYGREYDLDLFQIVAVDDFNFGAMENKGLNIFNAAALYATPELTTDAGFRTVRSIVAHEYFHNWSGNRVTLRDWFQLCLKEGFTVFRDQQFSCDFEGEQEERIRQICRLRERQFPEDAGPLAHPVRPDTYRQINNFYTATVYEKGAEIVRMLRQLLGEAKFRAGCDRYFSHCDGTAARVEDLIAAMEQAGGRDLQSFLHWYSQAGTPVVRAEGHWDEAGGRYRLHLRQSGDDSDGSDGSDGNGGSDDGGAGSTAATRWQPQHIPVKMSLLAADGKVQMCRLEEYQGGANGQDSEREEWLLELDEADKQWVFSGLKECPVPLLLRDFSAPVRLHQPLDSAARLTLASQSADTFNRWEAVQQMLLQAIHAQMAGEAYETDNLAALWRRILQDTEISDGIRTLLLTLPSPALAYQSRPARPVEFVIARQRLMVELAGRNTDGLQSGWERRGSARKYSPDPESMGLRAFANLMLHTLTLAAADKQPWWEHCRHQALTADNLTDQLGALTPLLDSGAAAADEVLEDWQQRWHDEPLLMDQWFAVQARVAEDSTLERVMALAERPDFVPNNPNRVRALLGTLGGNARAFHRADGAGYRFMAHWIGVLDQINPMVASSLLGAFANCALLPEDQRRKADEQLHTLHSAKALSKDVREQLGRLLKGRNAPAKQ